ncbi:MAG: dephospho-CoA kinase [Christensenellales bacterium]|jgi:dephospho-CoA kinase
MRIIGLTGGIAAGKSVVSSHLIKLGAAVISADEIAKRIMRPGGSGIKKIMEEMPRFAPDGVLDRAAFRTAIFSDPSVKRKSDALLHPIIIEQTRRRLDELKKAGVRAAVIDAPLLIEAGMQSMCDEVWLVVADMEQRIERIMARDGVEREQAEAAIRSQMPDDEKRKYALAVIDNSGTVEQTLAAAERLFTTALKGEGYGSKV